MVVALRRLGCRMVALPRVEVSLRQENLPARFEAIGNRVQCTSRIVEVLRDGE